jgi:predicted RNA polymerase sigma factor
VTDHGQPIHEQRVADEVDLLAEAADAVGSSEEQGVLEIPVDGLRVVPARVEASERLELIFTCCHPALATEAQVALTLRTLGGLTTEEIART